MPSKVNLIPPVRGRTAMFGFLVFLVFILSAAPSRSAETAVPQVSLADRMVQELASPDGSPNPNNSYGTPVTVTWKGILGADETYNRSQCASFITVLMKTAFGYTNDDYRGWFGSPSPSANRYQEVLDRGAGPFVPVKDLASLLPGDILAVKYPPEESATGHVMMVHKTPERASSIGPLIPGTEQYEVAVVDSSSGSHGPHDTRRLVNPIQQGVGRGTIRLYADEAGRIVGYAWSLESSTAYSAAERPIAAARIPVGADDPSPPPPDGSPPEDPPNSDPLKVTIDGRAKSGRITGTFSGPSGARVTVNVIRRAGGRRCLSVRPRRVTRTRCSTAKKSWFRARLLSGRRWIFRTPKLRAGRYTVRVRLTASGSQVTTKRRLLFRYSKRR